MVETVTWTTPAMVRSLVEGGRPAIVRGSPVDEWGAMDRWTPSRLSALAPTLRNVWASSSPNFRYATEVGGGATTYEMVNMSAPEFFAAAAHPQRYVYYSAPFTSAFDEQSEAASRDVRGDRGGPEQLMALFGRGDGSGSGSGSGSGGARCVLSQEIFASSSSPPEKEEEEVEEEVNAFAWCVRGGGDAAPRHVRAAAARDDLETILWIGAPGVTTNAHFDTVHNFFVQVRGAKRFRLVAPTAASIAALRLHTKLHTSRRQSRIDLGDDEAVAASALDASRDILEVTIGPGEVLYIPPYTFHHVRALGEKGTSPPAVSLAVWSSATPEHAAIDAAEAIAVPFEMDWEAPQRRRAAAAFCWRILQGVSRVSDSKTVPAPRTVVVELLLPRCGGGSHGDRTTESFSTTCSVADQSLNRKIAKRADAVAAAFARVPARARLLYLLDYVEVVASWAEGSETDAALCSFFAKELVSCEAADVREGDEL